MRTSSLLTAALTAAMVGVGTIDYARPTLISVVADTVIINGQQPVLLNVRALNRYGRSIWRPRLRYAFDSSSAVTQFSDGAVRCGNSGDASVALTSGNTRKSVVVRCRLIAHFGFPEHQEMFVGGPPVVMDVAPTTASGRPIHLLAARATVRDTSIATLRDGMIYPKRMGATTIDLEFSGGAKTAYVVDVRRRAIDTMLKLAPGEVRRWPLPPAYYDVRLDASDRVARAGMLVLGAPNANCALGHEGAQHFYCITKDSSGFVVANQSRRGGPVLVGRLSAVELPRARR